MVRGAKLRSCTPAERFTLTEEARRHLEKGGRFMTHAEGSGAILDQALDDVAEWLGFTDSHVYILALDQEGADIFKRATY